MLYFSMSDLVGKSRCNSNLKAFNHASMQGCSSKLIILVVVVLLLHI